jgi:hypothetical protein
MYEFFLGNVAPGIEESLSDNGSLKGSLSLALFRLFGISGFVVSPRKELDLNGCQEIQRGCTLLL